MEIKSNSTPLNVDRFKKNLMSIESGKKSGASSHVRKYNIILGISILSFIAGLSFWIFVNFML